MNPENVKQRWSERLLQWFRNPYLLLTVLILLIFGSMTATYVRGGDFHIYYGWSLKLFTTGAITPPPHLVFEMLLNVIRSIIPFNYISKVIPSFGSQLFDSAYQISSFIIVMPAYMYLGFLIFKYLRKKEIPGALWLTLGLMVVAPINLFTIPFQRLYIGYIAITTYQNPPMILLKPVALLLFWKLTENLVSETVSKKDYWIIALLSFLSVSIKPSFAICLLPASAIMALILILRHMRIHWKMYVFSFVLPTTIFLLIQYLYKYGSPDSQIIFQPFVEMQQYVPSIPLLMGLLVLSFAFPLLAAILNFREMKKDNSLVFIWITFIIAVLYNYLLVETGANFTSLNFVWSASIALFILFVETTVFVLKRYSLFIEGMFHNLKSLALYSLLYLHLLSGIVWYLVELFQKMVWWGL